MSATEPKFEQSMFGVGTKVKVKGNGAMSNVTAEILPRFMQNLLLRNF